ncbi:MAG: hypothetical protein KJO77_01085 [Bacteroidia bacterium]|nr:hypothetical protein [Bacteroidia bacterium]
MKTILSIFCIAIFLTGCKDEVALGEYNYKGHEDFETNSETVLKNLKGFQEENLDYSMYAEDFIMQDTGFGADPDSLNLAQMQEYDKQLWATYDFKMLTDPPSLLPGVDADTRIPNGSVRHYSDWEVTKVATDSTPAKSGIISLYETFDFDENGKILDQAVYGDFGGLMQYLHSDQ